MYIYVESYKYDQLQFLRIYDTLFSVMAKRLQWCTSGMATCPRTTFLNRFSLESLFLLVVLVTDYVQSRWKIMFYANTTTFKSLVGNEYRGVKTDCM